MFHRSLYTIFFIFPIFLAVGMQSSDAICKVDHIWFWRQNKYVQSNLPSINTVNHSFAVHEEGKTIEFNTGQEVIFHENQQKLFTLSFLFFKQLATLETKESVRTTLQNTTDS